MAGECPGCPACRNELTRDVSPADLADLKIRYALRGAADRGPRTLDAADELDRFIVQWIRGEVS